MDYNNYENRNSAMPEQPTQQPAQQPTQQPTQQERIYTQPYNANLQNNGYNPYRTYTQPNFTMGSQQSQTTGQTTGQTSYTTGNQPKKEKKKGKGSFFGKVVAAALIFGIVGGAVFTGVSYAGYKLTGIESSASTSKDKTSISVDKSVSQTTSGNASDLTDVSSIVSEVMPSIVAITNTSTVTYQSFWGGREEQESQSAGSGIIIKQDSEYLYIATNNHVVSGADKLAVQFADGKTVDAETRGTDPSDDLAVVQVKLSDIEKDTLEAIKVATIGDSDAITVGSASIAIGNALGYGQSVTTGVISALNRSITTQDETTGQVITNNNLIQTDAAINPGNSGGALLNAQGQVIGINSVKYASTEVEGIGYAIPMAYAVPILESLIDNGSYVDTQSAYLGIQGGDISEEMQAYGFPAGVYVANVIKGSGAEKAGIQEGDIITKIEDTELTGMTDLQNYLKNYKAGDKVKVNISRQRGRGFEEVELELTLSSAADMEE